jgi:hypothetical protein
LQNLDLYWSESLSRYVKTCKICLEQRKGKRIERQEENRVEREQYKEELKEMKAKRRKLIMEMQGISSDL